MSAAEPTRCLSVLDVAELLSCSRSQVYALVDAGELEAVRIGKRGLAITVPAYERFLAEHAKPAKRLRVVS